MAELNLQSREAKTTNSPKPRTPRWGKRILENLKIAGAATLLAGSLALSGCGNTQIRPVIPLYPSPAQSQSNPSSGNVPEGMPHIRISRLPNPILDPILGTFYHRPDGMDLILFKPELHGYPVILQTYPLLTLALVNK